MNLLYIAASIFDMEFMMFKMLRYIGYITVVEIPVLDFVSVCVSLICKSIYQYIFCHLFSFPKEKRSWVFKGGGGGVNILYSDIPVTTPLYNLSPYSPKPLPLNPKNNQNFHN